jgi:hypothetical protein
MSMFRKHMPDWLLRECLKLYAEQMYQEYITMPDLEEILADRQEAELRSLQKLERDNGQSKRDP